MKKISTKQKIFLILFGLCLCAILLEIGLRVGGFVLLSLQEYSNRISLRQKGTYRIMCLGESTTAAGGKDSYPSQLEEILNKRDIGVKFSVINKALHGSNTEAIVSVLEDNLCKCKPDMVITMMGINDGHDTMAYEDINSRRAILLFKSFRIYKLIKLLKLHIISKTRTPEVFKLNPKKEKRIKQIIETAPKKDDIYVKLASQYRGQERYAKKREKLLRKAIEINPINEGAYLELAMHVARTDKAEDLIKKVIEINPRNAHAYADLGWCYNAQERYNEAEEMIKKAVENDPEDYELCLGLGQWYAGREKYNKALKVFMKATKINPQYDRGYRGIAFSYSLLRKQKLAEEYYRKINILTLDYYNPITRHNYQKLKEMVIEKGIKLVCVQYPIRSVMPLKKMLKPHDGVIFVDNEMVFKEKLRQADYFEYFRDNFAGDFGHCTDIGNRLLAENIANRILKECF